MSLPAWLPKDERVEQRYPFRLPVSVSGPDIVDDHAMVVDISARGCRVVSDERLKVGTLVSIGLAGVNPVQGWVAWRDAGALGVDFVHPLPAAALATLTGSGAA